MAYVDAAVTDGTVGAAWWPIESTRCAPLHTQCHSMHLNQPIRHRSCRWVTLWHAPSVLYTGAKQGLVPDAQLRMGISILYS